MDIDVLKAYREGVKGFGPAEVAHAKVAAIVRELPNRVPLEQLETIVNKVADEFDIEPDEIDGVAQNEAYAVYLVSCLASIWSEQEGFNVFFLHAFWTASDPAPCS